MPIRPSSFFRSGDKTLMVDLVAAGPGIFSPRVLWRLLAIFLAAALLTGGVVLTLYSQELSNEHALYKQAGEHQVNLHADIIRREVMTVQSDLLYLANQEVLRRFLTDSVFKHRQELQNEYVLFCRQRGVYDQIRYLDASGRERIRVNYNSGRPGRVPERKLQDKASRYYFQKAIALGRGEVFFSPFDLNVEHEEIERPLKPMIRFGTPVFDRRGVKRGILVLNYLGAALIDKLAKVSGNFPGEVWLLNRDGFFLRGPSSDDEWGFMLGHKRTFATYFPDEWPRLALPSALVGPARRAGPGIARVRPGGPDLPEGEGGVTGGDHGQFRTEHGLFTFHTVSLPADRPEPDVASGRAGRNPWLTVVAHIPSDVLDGPPTRLLRLLLLLSGVILALVFVLAWYLAYAGVLRRDHERDLADSAARLRTLSTQLLTAQEDERRSLSRDLHDELGQIVTSVTIDLQRAAQADWAAGRERKDELLARALHGTGCLLDRIHEISARLRPTLLDDLGLRDAVQSFLSDYERRTGIVTQADLRFEQADVPPAVSENVYRILQEALTNVSKHARVPEVFVALHVAGGEVALTVRDLGVGLAPAALDAQRLGILGMRERAELLGGTFVLKAEPGRGTEIQVTIPIGQGSGVRGQGSEVNDLSFRAGT
jgi:signal transduction histidine kinase